MTTTKAARAKANFRTRLEEVGLSQRSFSKLLGVSAVTVNRWCSKREDALEVPEYARAYLAAFAVMSAEQRTAVLKEKGIAEVFEAVPPPKLNPRDAAARK